MENKSNLTYNEKVKRIVENIMNEKNDNPRDSSFKFLQEYHGEAQHASLRYPGKFVKTLPTEVFTSNNRNLRMDGAELVNPDNTLPCQSTLNPEQQTTEVISEKIHAMYDYKLHLTFKYKMPCLNVIVTNIGDNDHTVIYESHGDAFKTYVRVFTDEEINKRLNTLKNNIKNKKELSEIEVLDFAYVLLFAQENKAKEYSKNVANLFREVKNLNKSQQLDIHYVLKKLIRLHFRDDLKKTEELLTMITKAVHPEVLDSMTTLEKMNNKVEIMEKELTKMDNELSKKDSELSKKDSELSKKDNELSKKDKEILKLKMKLKEHDIKVD